MTDSQSRPSTIASSLASAGLLVLSGAILAGVALAAATLTSAQSLTATATAVAVLGPWFAPLERSLVGRLRFALAAAALSVAFAAAIAAPRGPAPGAALAVGLVLAAQLFLTASLAGLLARRTGGEAARGALVAVLAALCAAPVWLSPVAAAVAGDGAVASLVLALSPLAHLAVAAGDDVLRAPWFYSHSFLGALRFEYPSLLALTLFYTGATAGALLTFRSRQEFTT